MNIFVHLKRVFRMLPDEMFIHLKWRYHMRSRLHLNRPITYNEKLQWLKLYDRRPLYTLVVDKYLVKDYVSKIIGEEHVIPVLGKWNNFDEINFDELPNQFVLKCNHDCGGIVICRDKSKFDIEIAKQIINYHLKTNYYWEHREWPYKNVKPLIFAEKYMVDESGYELKDYKWFCFDGEPKMLFIAQDRSKPNEETKFDFYDMDFNLLPFTNGHPNSNTHRSRPQGFEEMKALASKLSAGFPHVRIDFYNINGQIYFGEYTLFHWSGFVKFEPEEWDYTLGSWIHLPKNND